MAERRRIGFLVNHLGWEGHYTNRLWRAAVDICRRKGFDLLVFTGPQDVSDYLSFSVQSAVFRLIDAQRLDGLILNAGLCRFDGREASSPFLLDFGGLPAVSIAASINDLPAVLADNAAGMQALVEHLIHAHGYRRQAFVCGPPSAQDGLVRHATWQQTLRAHGIEPDPDLVLQGDFVKVTDAQRLVDAWRSGKRFDAVVAASDLMARHIIAVLRDAGIRVPQDIAVVGFDDDPHNRYADPPLTSVSQPIYAQVETAIELLARIWRGEPPAPVNLLPCALQLRASCGCPRDSWTIDTALRNHVVAAAADADPFADAIDVSLGASDDLADRAFDLWSAIERLVVERHPNIVKLPASALHAAHNRLFLRVAARRGAPAGTASAQPHSNWDAALDALRVASFASLPNLMALHLPRLGIGKYCLSVMPTLAGSQQDGDAAPFSTADSAPDHEPGPTCHTCFTVVASCPPLDEAPDSRRFNASLIAPNAWIEQLGESTLLVLPVASRSTWHGLLVVELHPCSEAMLMQLQAALALVCDREYEVARAIRKNLSEWNRSFVMAEKTRTIGTLVRGVAHEINTPLGVSITVASVIRSELEGLDAKYQSNRLSRTNVIDYFTTCRSGLDQLERNLSRVARLVETFKKVSITQFGDQLVNCDLVDELAAVLSSFQAELSARFIHAAIDATRPMWIRAHLPAIQEILTDLIQNALDHAFPPGMQIEPRIIVSAALIDSGATARIRVADNGCGIAADMRGRIFDPFFTTRRLSGNVGLGLAIVSNLVTDGLGGVVECSANPGGGSVFEVRFPAQPCLCS